MGDADEVGSAKQLTLNNNRLLLLVRAKMGSGSKAGIESADLVAAHFSGSTFMKRLSGGGASHRQ